MLKSGIPLKGILKERAGGVLADLTRSGREPRGYTPQKSKEVTGVDSDPRNTEGEQFDNVILKGKEVTGVVGDPRNKVDEQFDNVIFTSIDGDPRNKVDKQFDNVNLSEFPI